MQWRQQAQVGCAEERSLSKLKKESSMHCSRACMHWQQLSWPQRRSWLSGNGPRGAAAVAPWCPRQCMQLLGSGNCQLPEPTPKGVSVSFLSFLQRTDSVQAAAGCRWRQLSACGCSARPPPLIAFPHHGCWVAGLPGPNRSPHINYVSRAGGVVVANSDVVPARVRQYHKVAQLY